MKKKLFKVLSLVVVFAMIIACIASLAACSKKTEQKDTLIVAYSNFSSKFSPFFASSAYDVDVYTMTQVGLLATDRGGNVIKKGIEGETIAYNGTNYTYYGLSNLTITQNDDGTVDYAIQMRTGDKTIYFSDGRPVTVKDAIFSMYVYSDNDYDGSTTFFSLPIKGMNEWRTNLNTSIYEKWAGKAEAILATYSDEIIQYDEDNNPIYVQQKKKDADGNVVKDGEGNPVLENKLDDDGNPIYDYATGYVYADSDEYTKAEWESLVNALQADTGVWTQLVNDIVNYCQTNYASYLSSFGNNAYALGMGCWGFGDFGDPDAGQDENKFYDIMGKAYTLEGNDVPTLQDYVNCLKAAYDDNMFEAADVEAGDGDIDSYIEVVVQKWIAESGKPEMNGANVTSISGITYNEQAGTINIKTTEYAATTIYQLTLAVSPMHYYGDESKWDPANGSYGFTRNNLDGVRSKTTQPMGAGPYKFVSFADGIVTFEANENYWEGAPKIKYLKFKEYSSDPDKLPALIAKEVDIATPSINDEVVALIKETNGSDQLIVSDSMKVATDLVDYNGYGYIGMNSNLVKVGTDKASAASKNLRKGIATLFAAYREYSVSSYYGDRASVIEYPITNCSWAAPQPADQGYEIAYSKDVNGNPIYTADMTAEQKYAAAKNAAIGFFKAAGYTWDEATKKFTAAPAGAKMEFEAIIGGGGTGDHPTLALLNKSSEVLETIGITLTVTDIESSATLFARMDAGTVDIFVAAWGGSADPDMYQVYHSDNKTNSNHYFIADKTLDEKIIAARKSADNAFRKATYKECLDIVLDWAVEIPVYQRKDCTVYNTETVNVNSLTPDTTPYWSFLMEIHKVELK